MSSDVTAGESLLLLGGGRRRLTLLARGHLPVGYSHGMAERRGAKGTAGGERGHPSVGSWWHRQREQEGTQRKTERATKGVEARMRPTSPDSHFSLPPPPFTIFCLPWPWILLLIAVSQCTRSERGLMNGRESESFHARTVPRFRACVIGAVD